LLVCGCDNISGSLSLGYNNNLSKAVTVAMTYHAARINYRSSQILDSNTMQHRGPQLKEKKNHTHVTHTAATWTAAAHNAAAGAKQRAALDPGVNTVVGSVSSSLRPRGVHGGRLHIQRRQRRGTVDDDRCVLAVTTAATGHRTAVSDVTWRHRRVLRSAPDHGVSSSVSADHWSWLRQWSRPQLH